MYVGRTNISSCKCLCLDTFLLLSRLEQFRVYGTEYTIDWIFISIDIIFFFIENELISLTQNQLEMAQSFLKSDLITMTTMLPTSEIQLLYNIAAVRLLY